jgi:predicted tellurium resistance membrane protein TerC
VNVLEMLADPQVWIALLTLCALEIVLGIDNIVFIAILSGRLPKEQQGKAYRLGMAAALITRLALLGAISWVMGLTQPLFELLGRGVSGRDLILLVGGLFLIAKASHEIYDKVELHEEAADEANAKPRHGFAGTIVQIMLLDIVFSLDSVITAVGMASEFWIMATAMITAVIVMLVFAQKIGDFVNEHPSMKVLALSFLLLIGVLLVAEGFGEHVSKGAIYFAMGFAFLVEIVNMRVRKIESKKKSAAT